jgi:hypothetical protein
MARRKTLPDSIRTKLSLAERLRQIRAEHYGERGGPELARRLGLPVRTWYNYEAGVTVPAEVVLKIIELTSVEPGWLLYGHEPKHRPRPSDDFRASSAAATSVSASSLLQAALRLLETDDGFRNRNEDPADTVPNGLPAAGLPHDLVLVEVDDPRGETSGPAYVPVSDEWLDTSDAYLCVRHVGNAMAPILEDGAYVVCARSEEHPDRLDGKLVVAWVDDDPVVRWFQRCGRYALLRAENPAQESRQRLIDLEAQPSAHRVRRVLGASTPHHSDRWVERTGSRAIEGPALLTTPASHSDREES